MFFQRCECGLCIRGCLSVCMSSHLLLTEGDNICFGFQSFQKYSHETGSWKILSPHKKRFTGLNSRVSAFLRGVCMFNEAVMCSGFFQPQPRDMHVRWSGNSSGECCYTGNLNKVYTKLYEALQMKTEEKKRSHGDCSITESCLYHLCRAGTAWLRCKQRELHQLHQI